MVAMDVAFTSIPETELQHRAMPNGTLSRTNRRLAQIHYHTFLRQTPTVTDLSAVVDYPPWASRLS